MADANAFDGRSAREISETVRRVRSEHRLPATPRTPPISVQPVVAIVRLVDLTQVTVDRVTYYQNAYIEQFVGGPNVWADLSPDQGIYVLDANQ